mgnify:CR=1 FL=1
MKDKINNIDEALLLEDEIIVRYLKGKMTTDEEEKFMQEVNSNDELKSKAVAIARMVKGMKEVGAASDKEVVDEFLAIDSDEIKTLAKNTSATNKVIATDCHMALGTCLCSLAYLWRLYLS